MVRSIGRSEARKVFETAAVLIFFIIMSWAPAIGALALANRKAKSRTDELWKEFDTHVRYCPCIKRDFLEVEEQERKAKK